MRRRQNTFFICILATFICAISGVDSKAVAYRDSGLSCCSGPNAVVDSKAGACRLCISGKDLTWRNDTSSISKTRVETVTSNGNKSPVGSASLSATTPFSETMPSDTAMLSGDQFPTSASNSSTLSAPVTDFPILSPSDTIHGVEHLGVDGSAASGVGGTVSQPDCCFGPTVDGTPGACNGCLATQTRPIRVFATGGFNALNISGEVVVTKIPGVDFAVSLKVTANGLAGPVFETAFAEALSPAANLAPQTTRNPATSAPVHSVLQTINLVPEPESPQQTAAAPLVNSNGVLGSSALDALHQALQTSSPGIPAESPAAQQQKKPAQGQNPPSGFQESPVKAVDNRPQSDDTPDQNPASPGKATNGGAPAGPVNTIEVAPIPVASPDSSSSNAKSVNDGNQAGKSQQGSANSPPQQVNDGAPSPTQPRTTLAGGVPGIAAAPTTASLDSSGLLHLGSSIIDVKSNPTFTMGGQTYTAANPSSIVIAGATLKAGGAPQAISNSGTPSNPSDQAVSLGSSGILSIGGSSTINIAATPTFTLNGESYTAANPSAVEIGGSTLTPGGAPLLVPSGTSSSPEDQTPVSLAPSGILHIGLSSTINLSATPTLTLNGQTYTATNPSSVILAGSTLTPGGADVTITTPSSAETPEAISLASSGILHIGPTSTINLSATPTFTIGSSSYTATNPSTVVVNDATLSPGGAAILTLLPSTTAISDVFTVGGETFTATQVSQVAIDGTTISAGGAGVTIAGTPVSVEPGGKLKIGSSEMPLATGGTLPGALEGSGGKSKVVCVWLVVAAGVGAVAVGWR